MVSRGARCLSGVDGQLFPGPQIGVLLRGVRRDETVGVDVKFGCKPEAIITIAILPPIHHTPHHNRATVQNFSCDKAAHQPNLGINAMNLIVLIIILLILFGGGGFYYGGPYVGGGLGTILLIILIVLLLR